jgi:Holliday junction resolvase RusA-like endonuclease
MGISARDLPRAARERAGIKLGPGGRALPALLDPVAGHCLIDLAMDPPTATHHDKEIRIRNGHRTLIDSPALRAARDRYEAALPHRPGPAVVPLLPPVLMIVSFVFRAPADPAGPADGWHTDTPDVDNAVKLVKDVLAGRGYFADDKHVALEIAAKRLAAMPRVRVYLRTLLSPGDPGLEYPIAAEVPPGWVTPVDPLLAMAARGEWEDTVGEWPYQGHRRAAIGQRPAASGQRPAASGQRPAASGQRPAASGQRPAARTRR